jgi:threonine dehydratase
VKREDLQPVRSYKLRGAYNRIAQLSDEERAAGVVCASAGNHGQGVAFACQRLGINGRIFVPSTTPRQKRDRMVAIGGGAVQLVVVGDTYDEAAAAALADAARTGAVLVHAFDHPETIATAIRIGNPASWQQAVAARDESGGLIHAVTDEQILAAHRLVSAKEGVFVEPGSAASVAGLLASHEAGLVPPGARIVCTVTGHGLKDPQRAIDEVAVGAPVAAELAAVTAELGL